MTRTEDRRTFWYRLTAVVLEMAVKRSFIHSFHRSVTTARVTAVCYCRAVLQVICTTCSTAGSLPLKTYRFHRLLIDEAAQACETSCLVPLSRGARTVCIIGDDKQLPPLVKSVDAAQLKTSLFERSAINDGFLNVRN